MAEPDAAVFYAELLDDELGEGIRLYDATDAVYEMREDTVQTRIYREDDTWRVKTRTAVDGLEEAYETFRDTAHRVGDVYGRDGTVPAYGFMNDPAHRHLSFDEDILDGELRYRITDGIDLDVDPELGRRESLRASATVLGVGIGGLGSIGAALGGGAGLLLFGDPVPGAMAGGSVGGAMGTVGGITDIARYGEGEPDTAMADEVQRRREKVQKDGKTRLRKWGAFIDPTLLERVNERNRLAAEKDSTEDYGKAERLQELEADDGLTLFDTAMQLHFDRFHAWDGVIVDATVDTYDEARRLASSIADTPHDDSSEPSIYGDVDAFRGVFAELPDRGKDALVENVLEHGADRPVRDFLERQHGERVRRVGGETRLQDGPAGPDGGSAA